MTIADLAELAGVSDGTIAGIEGGTVGWTNKTLHKLAIALGITTGMLLDVNPLEDQPFWRTFEEADEDQRERIAEHAEVIIKRRPK